MLDHDVDPAFEQPARERGPFRAARRAAHRDAGDTHVVRQRLRAIEHRCADAGGQCGGTRAAAAEQARDAIRTGRREARRVELAEAGAGHDDRQRVNLHRASFRRVSTNAAFRQSK